MYAVVECRGKQYTVSCGDELCVDRLAGDAGDSMLFDRVLMVVNDDKKIFLDSSDLEGAKVSGTIIKEEKGKKIIVFKFKRRKGYRRKQGHRQKYTRVKVDQIEFHNN